MKRNTFAATVLALLPCTMAFDFCPPTGPLLPPPKSDKFDAQPLTDALGRLVNESVAFDTSTSSFSVTITTTEDTIFQFHHTAPQINDTGVTTVDGNSIYRIASVSKLFTVLSVLLQEGLDLDHYIWEYVPELAGLDDFREITLRLLASHLSGVVRDGYVFESRSRAPLEALVSLGFPNVILPSDYPTCDSVGTPPCSRAEFLQGITREELIWLPGHTPAYSNYAFVLLGFAVEAFTNKSLEDVITDSIISPLGMSSASGLQIPDISEMVVPAEGSDWSVLDFGNWKATGGLFTTPLDLSRFLRGILNNELLSPIETANWLKPRSFTSSSTGGAVGMPWAIVRPVNVPRASGLRPLEIYTMLGSFPTYGAYVAVIPEYQIGVTVNIAGPGDDPASRALLDLVVQHVVPAFDDFARIQAEERYVGSYKDASGDEDSGSSLVLVLDDGPGLKIKEWTSAGKNVSEAWVALNGGSYNAVDSDMRIYPVGEGSEQWHVAFRAITEKNETGIFKTVCDTWFGWDAFLYAGYSVDQIDFVVDESGGIIGLDVPGLRQNLTRI